MTTNSSARTVRPIRHSSKIMLQVIITRLNPKLKSLSLKPCWVKSRMKYYITDLEPHNLLLKVSSTSAESVPCPQIFQKGFWQDTSPSLTGPHSDLQYQCNYSSLHWATLWNDRKCRSDEWQHARIVKKQQLEWGKDVFSHLLSLTFSRND